MRLSTATSADRLMNLYQAVKIATSESSKGCGPLVVLNDRIASGFWTTKVSGFALDTFRPREHGFLGVFFRITRLSGTIPQSALRSSIFKTNELPEVIILYAYQGLNADLYTALLNWEQKVLFLLDLEQVIGQKRVIMLLEMFGRSMVYQLCIHTVQLKVVFQLKMPLIMMGPLLLGFSTPRKHEYFSHYVSMHVTALLKLRNLYLLFMEVN